MHDEVLAVDSVRTLFLLDPGTIQLLNGIRRGSEVDERHGSVTRAVSLQYRLSLSMVGDPATFPDAQFVRCVLLIDRDPQGVQFTMGDLFNFASVFTWVSQYRLDNRARFDILLDFTKVLSRQDNDGSAWFGSRLMPLSFTTYYDNTLSNTLVTSIRTNALYWVIIPSIATGIAGPSVILNSFTRFRYTST